MSNATQMVIPVENEAEVLKQVQEIVKPEQVKPEIVKEVVDDSVQQKTVDALEIDEAEKVVEGQLDMESLFAEYTEKGELSEETSKSVTDALTKAGFKNPEALLQQYIAGYTAQTQAQETQVSSARSGAFEIAGGEQGYASMIEWAKANLAPGDIKTFNEAVSNPAMVPLAVRGLHAQYTAAQGGKRVSAGGNVNAAMAPVTSNEQVAELVSDPKYRNDPGHRASIDARIKASMDAGLLK